VNIAFVHRPGQPSKGFDPFGWSKFDGGSSGASTYPPSATPLGVYMRGISNWIEGTIGEDT
jgi:hypothetical protein